MSLDTTVGGTAADSYATVADADAYLTSTRGFATSWTALTTQQKEQALRWAAVELDANFRFRGKRTSRDQARQWPRFGAEDDDGWWAAEDEIPAAVKLAQAEYAFQLSTTDWTQGLGPVVDGGVTVGPVKTTKEEHNRVPDSVERLISRWVNGAGGTRSVDVEIG